MDEKKTPTNSEIEEFIKEYGWSFRKTVAQDREVLLCPLTISTQEGILISLRVEGDFVIVSTVDFMNNVSSEDTNKLFSLNDTLKLVKLFPVSQDGSKVEIGFELWAEAWNKLTFFAFMDMLCMAIEKVLNMLDSGDLSFTPRYLTFE